MATPLDPNPIVPFEEPLMSRVVLQEALVRLLVEKGIFARDGFLERVRGVDMETKKVKGVIGQ